MNDETTPPWLRGRRPPPGLNGWVRWVVPPEGAIAEGARKASKLVVERAVQSGDLMMILLGHNAGLSPEKIAKDIGLSVATVRNLILAACHKYGPPGTIHDHRF